jgi:hypothetical protein
MPEDAATLEDVFEAMPSSIDGVPLEGVVADGVVYSEGEARYLAVRASSMAGLPTGPEGEEMTTQRFVSLLMSEAETIEVEQLDESEPLVYVAGTALGDGETIYMGSWAIPDADLVFSVSADTPEARTQLVHAFIEACGEIE